MAQPIVFISHFTVRAGKLEGLRSLAEKVVGDLDAGKPETLGYLIYLGDTGTQVTFVHVFGSADAMDRHFEGAEQRSGSAMRFMEPSSWEIYGEPSPAALKALSDAAALADVPLSVQHEFEGGFLRLRLP